MNLSSIRAADLMQADVVTISASAGLPEAIQLMHDRGLRALLVPPQNPGEGYGILTTKDVVGLLDSDDTDLLDAWKVSELMTRPAVTVPETMGIRDCLRLMRMTGVRRVPVLRGDALTGVLSYSDVFRWLAQQPARA